MLRPVDIDADRSTLVEWLNRDHVKRWWGDPQVALDEILNPHEHYGQFIIQADGRDIGYIQWGMASRKEIEEAGLSELPEGFVSLDILIGESGYLGRGQGPAAISELLSVLLTDDSITRVGLGTSIDNRSAIRSYEKVGFVKQRQYDDPEIGRAWLMVVTRDSFNPLIADGR